MTPVSDHLDHHVIVVCSPLKSGATSTDLASWDYRPGDPLTDVVVIPERYFHDIAAQLAPSTKSMGVFWTTYEEDWIENPSDVKKFRELVFEAASNPALWKTRTHREFVYAISALADRAAGRSAPIIFVS